MQDYVHIGERDQRRVAHCHQHGLTLLAEQGVRLLLELTAQPGYGFLQSKPTDGVLVHSLDGAVRVGFAGQESLVPAGMICWCPAGGTREVRVLGEAWHGTLVFLDQGELHHEAGDQMWTINCKTSESLVSALRGVFSEVEIGVFRDSLGGFSQALLAWLRRLFAERGPSGNERDTSIERLRATILTQPWREWSMSEMALLLGVSVATLRRWVESRVGVSPRLWLLRLRMEVACSLLSGGSDPLKSIAERVGYSQPFSFSAAFKRHVGLSPSAFRKQARMEGPTSKHAEAEAEQDE